MENNTGAKKVPRSRNLGDSVSHAIGKSQRWKTEQGDGGESDSGEEDENKEEVQQEDLNVKDTDAADFSHSRSTGFQRVDSETKEHQVMAACQAVKGFSRPNDPTQHPRVGFCSSSHLFLLDLSPPLLEYFS